jgi:Transposase DDE domain
VRLPREAYPIQVALATHLPVLSPAQQQGLGWWVYGALLAGSACQGAVVTALEPVVGAGGTGAVRQRLREWLAAGVDKAVPCRAEVAVASCFAPLLRWIVSWWQGTTLPLAVDATALGDRVVVLSISVLYRGSAIPVAWHSTVANRPGAWLGPIQDLLLALAPAVPPGMEVLVLADRGLWSPRLWDALRALGWHPLLRIRQDAIFRPLGGRPGPAARLVPGPGHAWIGAGVAYKDAPKRTAATLIVLWEAGHPAPCLVLTDLAPEAVGPCWYGLRAWIELGFRALKSLGWHWERTRRTAPDRVARHWLVLAVATLWVLATGTRVEDADRVGRDPAHLRVALPPPTACVRRTVSVFARGLARLRWQLLRVRRLWTRLWFWPDPWPHPPPGLVLVVVPLHV